LAELPIPADLTGRGISTSNWQKGEGSDSAPGAWWFSRAGSPMRGCFDGKTAPNPCSGKCPSSGGG